MKKYIKNLSKLSMVVVSAVALFFFSFNTNAQQEPGCTVEGEIRETVTIIVDGTEYIECVLIGTECYVAIITCDVQ